LPLACRRAFGPEVAERLVRALGGGMAPRKLGPLVGDHARRARPHAAAAPALAPNLLLSAAAIVHGAAQTLSLGARAGASNTEATSEADSARSARRLLYRADRQSELDVEARGLGLAWALFLFQMGPARRRLRERARPEAGSRCAAPGPFSLRARRTVGCSAAHDGPSDLRISAKPLDPRRIKGVGSSAIACCSRIEAGIAGDRVSTLVEVPTSDCAVVIARGSQTIEISICWLRRRWQRASAATKRRIASPRCSFVRPIRPGS